MRRSLHRQREEIGGAFKHVMAFMWGHGQRSSSSAQAVEIVGQVRGEVARLRDFLSEVERECEVYLEAY